MTKILLVEDNEMNKDMLSRRLTKKGYEVIFAMDGQEAIDMAQSETPDVILMDMGLPVKDGGCDEYETKPVRLPSLLEKIEQFT